MARYTVDVLNDSGQRVGFVPTPMSPSYRRRQNQATSFSFGVVAEDAALFSFGRRCILRRNGVEKAAGFVTRRDFSGQVLRVECVTNEALLRDLITPSIWNYWAGWELGDAVRDLLSECVVQARNTPEDWANAVEAVDVDIDTMPGHVVLAKGPTGRYRSHGYITLQFDFAGITRYQVLRWSEDVGEDVRIKAQFRTSSDGLTWGPWSEELQSVFPAEDGVALTGDERYIQVRMHLYTDNTSAKDQNGVPTGYTPVLNGVEVIARKPGPVSEGVIEDTEGVILPAYRSENEDQKETYSFDRENALRILQTWCEDFGYEFKVDGQRRLYFGKDLGAVKPIVLRRTTNMDIKSLGDSADRLANVLHCYGAGDGPAQIRTTLRNEDSISLYGERIGVFEDSSADTLAKLIESGNKHLAKVSVPEPQFVVHHVPIDELPEDMELYDTVTVVDPKSGVVTEARILDDERTLTTTSEDVSLGLNCTLDNVIERIVKNQAPRPQPGGLPAAAPWNLQAKVGYGYVQLSWSGKATEFVVEHSVDGVSFDVLSRTPYRYYLHTGLQPGSTHYYRVTAVTSGGASAPSVVVPAAVSHVPIEDLDPTPPDTPVWDTCEFTRNIVLRWHAAASAVEYEIREVDDDWGETVGQVWRGSATSATLTPTKRSHTFYIRAISLAGVYSTEAASITLTNDTPSTPPAPLVEAFFGALAITLRPVPDDDIVSYQLYVTPVDEQGTAVGDTEAIAYPYAGRVVYQAAPGTRLRLEVTAADVLGEGGKSAPVFAATATLADADIPDGIITESHLTESLREAIEESDLGDIPHRLEVVESELDPDTPGSVRSQVLQLADEITLKVQRRADGRLVVTGIGVAVDEEGQSEVAVLADRFRVLTSTDGEMKSVFAVDSQQGKVYILGDMIAEGLIRAEEVHTEIAKALLLSAQVATIDDLDALRIRAESISVSDGTPLFDEDGKLDADAGGIKAMGSQITLDSTGLKMRRAGETIDRMHLDARRLLFRDPASGEPTVGMGWVHDVAQEIDPEADPDDLIKYGLFVNQGEIRASQSVLRQSLTDYSVGQQHIEDGSVTLRKLGSALSVSSPDRMMLIYHENKSFSTEVTEDVIINWNFENGTTGWTGTGTVAANRGLGGSYALYKPRNFYQDVPVSAYVGMAYRARVYAISNQSSSSRLLRFTITYLDASHTALGDPIVREYQVPGTVWYEFSIIGEIPDGVAYLRYTLHDVNDQGSYWDDARLEVAEISPYFEYTIPAEECVELLRIEFDRGPWVVWINGEEVLQTSGSGASSADIDVRAFDGDLHIVARKPSPTFGTSETMKLWINERLPVRGAVPRYSIASCDGMCQSTCQLACQGTCEAGCQAACESACQTSCQRECQSTCQESCQQACQTSCQSTCEKTSQGGGGCWVAGTPVSVYDPETGEVSEIPVERLQPGMLVPYYDPADDSIKTCECLSNDVSYTSTIYVVEVEGGYRLEATGEQPLDVLRQEHWHTLAVRFLRPGDKLVRPYDGTLHDVLSVTREVRAKTVVFNPRTTSGRYIVQGFSDQTKVVD